MFPISFRCPFCSNKFFNLYKQHLNLCHGPIEVNEEVRCTLPSCDWKCSTGKEYLEHLNNQHDFSKESFQEHGSNLFECKMCNFQSEELNSIMDHNKIKHEIDEIESNVVK